MDRKVRYRVVPFTTAHLCDPGMEFADFNEATKLLKAEAQEYGSALITKIVWVGGKIVKRETGVFNSAGKFRVFNRR